MLIQSKLVVMYAHKRKLDELKKISQMMLVFYQVLSPKKANTRLLKMRAKSVISDSLIL